MINNKFISHQVRNSVTKASCLHENPAVQYLQQMKFGRISAAAKGQFITAVSVRDPVTLRNIEGVNVRWSSILRTEHVKNMVNVEIVG